MNLDRILAPDRFLLDRVFQPVVDWLGRRWGMDFVKLGSFLGWAAIGANVATTILYFRNMEWWVAGMLVTTWLIVDIGWAWLFWMAAKLAKRSARLGLINENRYRAIVLRHFSVLSALVPFFDQRVWWILASLAWYVLSCQAPPPKVQREPFWSKWLAPAA